MATLTHLLFFLSLPTSGEGTSAALLKCFSDVSSCAPPAWIRLLLGRICRPLERKQNKMVSQGQETRHVTFLPFESSYSNTRDTYRTPVCWGVFFFLVSPQTSTAFAPGRPGPVAGRGRGLPRRARPGGGRGARGRSEEGRGQAEAHPPAPLTLPRAATTNLR